MVVLFQQYTENICFFSNVSAGGLRDWGILLVISLEFQGNKASTIFYDTVTHFRACRRLTYNLLKIIKITLFQYEK